MKKKHIDKPGKILLLSQSYAPIGLVNWRKALDLVMFRFKAEVVADYEDVSNFNPAVIRLIVRTPDPYKLRKASYTKSNVFRRDDYTCVYCGRQLPVKQLTIDHVLPRSRGGQSSYNNCVTACKACNHHKDARTPEEAGMRTIYRKEHKTTLNGIFLGRDIPEQWAPYV